MNEELFVVGFTQSWGKMIFSRELLLEYISMLRMYPGAEELV